MIKRPYLTKAEALEAAGRSVHPTVVPYRCPDCRFWHIGKSKT